VLLNVIVEVDIVVSKLKELLNVIVEEVNIVISELKELLNIIVEEVDTVIYRLKELVPPGILGNRVIVSIAIIISIINVIAKLLIEGILNSNLGLYT
jgi:hypothetical protein